MKAERGRGEIGGEIGAALGRDRAGDVGRSCALLAHTLVLYAAER